MMIFFGTAENLFISRETPLEEYFAGWYFIIKPLKYPGKFEELDRYEVAFLLHLAVRNISERDIAG